MKVGILTGVAQSAQLKALIYAKSIVNAGHTYEIIARSTPDNYLVDEKNTRYGSTVFEIISEAISAQCDFFIGCTDNLGNAVTLLNLDKGFETIPLNATDKTNLYKLENSKLSSLRTWKNLDDVPSGLSIFVKPINGSGSIGGDPWCYKKFESVNDFKLYLSNELEDGIKKFEYAQSNPRSLGECIFQEYVEDRPWIYNHYLNDGSARQWMKTYYEGELNVDTICRNDFTDEDVFDFKSNIPFGTMCGLQAFEMKKGKPKVFDFNVRSGGYWTTLYSYLCPDFFDVYFDNLLNKKNNRPNFICEGFWMKPAHISTKGKHIIIADYPQSNLSLPYSIELI